MADRTVAVRLRAEISDYLGGMRTAGRAAGQLREELGQLDRAQIDDITTAAGGVGLALVGAAGYAVKMGMDFDKAMSGVSAATHAGAADMAQLRQAALDAGQATAYSATEAARAETELAKAGVAVRDILSGGLKGALDLAAAGQMDVGEAAETAATAMVQFGLSGKDLPHVADLLAAGANNAQGEVHDMGMALKQSGLVANQFGLSIEETTGTLAAFASSGMLGSDAGTSLKTMLLMLANPSKESAALMRQLGINAYDATGTFVGMRDLAGQLQTTMAGLTQAQRDQAMAQIFGADAIRSANVLYQQGASGISDWMAKVDDVGAATDTAREKTNNLAGDLERLKGSIETMAISAGSGASGGLRDLAQGANRIVDSFAAIPGSVLSGGVAIAGIAGSALLAATATSRLQQTTRDAMSALAGAGPAGAKFAAGTERVIGVVGKLTAGLVALQLASAAMGESVSPAMGKLSKDLTEFGKSGKVGGEAARLFGDGLDDLKYDLSTLDTGRWSDFSRSFAGVVEGATGMGAAMDQSLVHAKQRLTAIDQAMAQLVASGKTDQAAAAFERLKKVAADQGISVNELMRALPQYAAALDGATDAAGANAGATGQAATATAQLGDTLGVAIEKAGGFKQAWDEVTGKLRGSLDATIAAEQAIDDFSASLERNKNQWDLNTQAGRDNTNALTAGIEKAAEAAQAKYAETGSVEAANQVYLSYLQRLRDSAGNNVELRNKIDELISTYGRMPKLVSTEVKASGLDAATEKAYDLLRKLWQIDGTVSNADIYVSLHADDVREANRLLRRRWGGVTEYARDGLLSEAKVFPAGSRPLYGFAEPGTGGEAFIPRTGDLARSRAIAEHVVGDWLGGTVAWGGRSGGAVAVAAPVINVNVYAGIGADASAISTRTRAAIVDVLDNYRAGNVTRRW